MKSLYSCLFAMGMMALASSCSKQTQQPFEGNWYANQYGCRTEVTFNPDTTITLKSEANVNANMTVPYTVVKDSVEGQYLFDMQMGMDNRGIAVVDDDNHLQIAVVFGPEQYMPRPSNIDDVKGIPTSLVLDLYRDSTMVTSALNRTVEAPESAKLAFERNKRLGKGLCLNGYVDANPVDGNDAPMSEKDFEQIALACFNSVRIPITWVKHASTEAPYAIDENFFKKIDWTIEQCLKNNIAVSIDQHYYPYINMSEDDPDLTWDQNLDRIKSFWTQISERYKDLPNDMVYFDLLNEPNTRLGADGLNKLHAELIDIIRKTNPERTVIVGTPNLGQTWTLGELEFPENEWNIIVQAHCYTPFLFTHQNLEYVPQAASPTDVEWTGTPEEKAALDNDMLFCKKWSDANHRPINIGEYGVCLKADQQSRDRYFSYIQSLFDKYGFSSDIWAYRGLFGLYDLNDKKWDDESLKSLGLNDVKY